MSKEKQTSSEDLFKDYVPEIIEYDAKTDASFVKKTAHSKPKREKDTEALSLEITVPEYTEEFLKNYVLEVVEYDEEVDGTLEHMGRANHLNTKKSLLEKIKKAKAAAKGNQITFRQPIRTENEKS